MDTQGAANLMRHRNLALARDACLLPQICAPTSLLYQKAPYHQSLSLRRFRKLPRNVSHQSAFFLMRTFSSTTGQTRGLFGLEATFTHCHRASASHRNTYCGGRCVITSASRPSFLTSFLACWESLFVIAVDRRNSALRSGQIFLYGHRGRIRTPSPRS